MEIVDGEGRAVASVLDSGALETLEILANPEAMRAIRAAKAGRMEYRPLEETNKEQAAQKAKSRKRRVR